MALSNNSKVKKKETKVIKKYVQKSYFKTKNHYIFVPSKQLNKTL